MDFSHYKNTLNWSYHVQTRNIKDIMLNKAIILD